MHTVCLSIQTTKEDRLQIDRSFHALSHLHNVLVKHVQKLLIQLDHNKDYQNLRNQYIELLRADADKKQKSLISKQMEVYRRSIGLSEYQLQSYLKVCSRQFRKLLSSQQVQKEVSHVWSAVEKYLFGNGKSIHFKKYIDFDTISGKSNKNGVQFDPHTFTAVWMKHTYQIRRPKKSSIDYVYEALDTEISYCEIKRIMFPNGWHYYLIVVCKGDAPKKLIPGDHTCGIDPGVSTMAAVSEDQIVLKELAPKIKPYNQKIVSIQQHMDHSKRSMNPNKYHSDGTINCSDHSKWIQSNTYRKNQRKLRFVYGRKSRYIKQSHNELVNELIRDSRYFYIEKMDYSALARRSKQTVRQKDVSLVKNSTGQLKSVHKFHRKKRFGKSLNNRAPAMFLQQLKQKAALYGGKVIPIETKCFKASQYNHLTDCYEKVPLSQRSKKIGTHEVQRDLYSAFLIWNTDDTLTHPDREKCNVTFEDFVTRQNEYISRMKKDSISMKQCFGF